MSIHEKDGATAEPSEARSTSALRMIVALLVLVATWIVAHVLAIVGLGMVLDEAWTGPNGEFDWSSDGGTSVLGEVLVVFAFLVFVLSGLLPRQIARVDAFAFAPLLLVMTAIAVGSVAAAF